MISKRAMITVDIQSARTQLQGHILKALQDELREKILVESEYIIDIKEKIDPLKLIKLVESVAADTIRTDDNKLDRDINRQYYALKQNELSLVDYFNKFNEVLVKMKTYLQPNEIPSEKKQAFGFFDGLDSHRFGYFRQKFNKKHMTYSSCFVILNQKSY